VSAFEEVEMLIENWNCTLATEKVREALAAFRDA